MNYTLNQLNVFLKVSQTLNITKAAEELHLTQPAVSIQLKNFQQQFDIPLIEVVQKKLYLTDFGKEIAEAAERIIEEAKAIEYKMHEHQGALTGKLKVASVSTGIYIAPYFLGDFIKSNENIELMLDVTNKSQVIESLELNKVDFAFVSVLPEHLNIEHIELLSNKLYLIGNQTSPEKNQELDKLPLIFREKGSGTRHVMEKYLLNRNMSLKPKLELTGNEAIKHAVIAGLGYSIMPLIGIKQELDKELLKIIPRKEFPIESKWMLIWMKNKKLSSVANAFLKHLESTKTELIHNHFSWA
ncbi:MAG: LysR family transcriptional regulator [Bacteroidia bacterium]|nr:LysR family transcriptional regulator [Bacteroidia bacterium]